MVAKQLIVLKKNIDSSLSKGSVFFQDIRSSDNILFSGLNPVLPSLLTWIKIVLNVRNFPDFWSDVPDFLPVQSHLYRWYPTIRQTFGKTVTLLLTSSICVKKDKSPSVVSLTFSGAEKLSISNVKQEVPRSQNRSPVVLCLSRAIN